ncbi:MAG: helix-turn-helix transcriptional regulator [Anaerostipes sp.]|nr:helix-turn-helix transcriptional regulator [Anaerostipes sp.]
METIAKRIKDGLSLRNMKQADLVEKTGIGKSSISTYISGAYEPKQRNIYKIAKALDVSETWLMGYDVPINKKNDFDDSLTHKDKKDILDILGSTKEVLLSQDGLMFDGDPASPEAIDSILNAMEVGMEMAKKKNKEKYTPKKYKKD